MSKMKYDRKPPLAKSPIRLRTQRFLRSSNSNNTSVQTPFWFFDQVHESYPNLGHERICSPVRVLLHILRVTCTGKEGARVGGIGNGKSLGANSTPMLERGRLYEEYATRRNERLKRKKGGETEDVEGKIMATPYNLGVTVGSSKRRDSKRLESLRNQCLPLTLW